MKRWITLLTAALSLAAAVGLPEVRDAASKPLAPVTEFAFAAPVDSPKLWIETAGGAKKPVTAVQVDGVVRLAAGETLVMDGSLLSVEGTLAVSLRPATGYAGSLVQLPFGQMTLAMDADAKRTIRLVNIPGADANVRLAGQVPDKLWTLLSVGYTPSQVQFHLDGQFIGMCPAKLEAPSGLIRIGGKMPLEVLDVNIYDVRFDFNDVLKAVARNPRSLSDNAKALGCNPVVLGMVGHPRLLATAEEFDQLRAMVKTDPAMAALLARYVTRYEREIAQGVPKEEQVGEIKRLDGNRLAMLAILYRATGDQRYVDTAQQYINRIIDYRIWDGDRLYWTNNDLVTGHLLLGLALAYDWMYDALPVELKERMCEVVRFRAGGLAMLMTGGKWTWANQVMNNHGCVVSTGLLAAAAAFAGEVSQAGVWAAAARNWMKTYLANQPVDGGDYEGIGYTQYALGSVLIYADLARSEFGDDCYRDTPWLQKVMDFRIQSSIPQRSWVTQKLPGNLQRLDNALLSFGDTRQRDYFIPTGPARKLAAEYKRGEYLAFADQIDAVDNFCNAAEFLSLLYLYQAQKSGVKPVAAPLPAFGFYPQVGKVLMRSGWDGDESLMIFRCGTPSGTEALKNFNNAQGDGHVHPDVGAVSLFAAGELMLINSDYSYKLTKHENTVTVNGIGQRGDDRQWSDPTEFYQNKLAPAILRAETHGAFDYVVGDATAAYRPESGLTRFQRHILFLKPDCFVILDDVAADRPSMFEARYHSLLPGKADGSMARLTGERGELAVRLLLPADAKLNFEATEVRLIDHASAPRKTNVITLSNPVPTPSALFLTVLCAGPKGQNTDFSATFDHDVITIRNGGKVRQVKLVRDGGLRLQAVTP